MANSSQWVTQLHDGSPHRPLDPAPVISIPLMGSGPSGRTFLSARMTTMQLPATSDGGTRSRRYKSLPPFDVQAIVRTGHRDFDAEYPDRSMWMDRAHIVLENIRIPDPGRYYFEVYFQCDSDDERWVRWYDEQHGNDSEAFTIHASTDARKCPSTGDPHASLHSACLLGRQQLADLFALFFYLKPWSNPMIVLRNSKSGCSRITIRTQCRSSMLQG